MNTPVTFTPAEIDFLSFKLGGPGSYIKPGCGFSATDVLALRQKIEGARARPPVVPALT